MNFRLSGVFGATFSSGRGTSVFVKWLVEIKSVRDPKAVVTDAVSYGHYIDLKIKVHSHPETQVTDEGIIYRFVYDYLRELKEPLLPAYNDASKCRQMIIIRLLNIINSVD